MNSFLGIIFLTYLVYSLLYERIFAYIFGTVLLVYLSARLFLKNEQSSPFRSIYQNALESPRKADCYLTIVADVTEVLKIIKENNEKLDQQGARLTITHFVTKALAITLAKYPQCGTGRLAFGKYIPRDTIDISLLVDMETEYGRDLGFFKIKETNLRSIQEIAKQTKGKSSKLRSGRDKNFKESQLAFTLVPSFVGQ